MTRTALLIAAVLLSAPAAFAGEGPSATNIYGADCASVSALPAEAPALRGFDHDAAPDRYCEVSGSSMAIAWEGTATHYGVRTYSWNGSAWRPADEYLTTGRAADVWFQGKARYHAVALVAYDGDQASAPGRMVVVRSGQDEMAKPSERAAVEALQHFVQRLQRENRELREELRAAAARDNGEVAAK